MGGKHAGLPIQQTFHTHSLRVLGQQTFLISACFRTGLSAQAQEP